MDLLKIKMVSYILTGILPEGATILGQYIAYHFYLQVKPFYWIPSEYP